MDLEIKQVIGRAEFTRTEKKVATYVMEHLADVCCLTAFELAERCGVSDTSVIRFAKNAGFKGYMELQKACRREFLQTAQTVSQEVIVPAERLQESMHVLAERDLFEQHRRIVEENIHSICRLNTEEDFEKACDILRKAKRRFIIGTRSRTGLAEFLGLILNQLLDNVLLNTSQAMTPFDFLASCGKNDCLVLFSFPRYSKLDEETLAMARDSGMPVILITDSMTASPAKYADVRLLVHVNSSAYFNSYAAVQFLSELLCEHISAGVKLENKEKLEKINRYLGELELY